MNLLRCQHSGQVGRGLEPEADLDLPVEAQAEINARAHKLAEGHTKGDREPPVSTSDKIIHSASRSCK